MRKILCSVALVLLASAIYSQAPGLFNYQGVARNSVGNVLQNKSISLRLSIHDATENGPVVYSETRTVTTNPFGLFNIQVGSAGASTTIGTITAVNWAIGKKYIQVEIDPAGGSAFINIGTSQLASVPFALHAAGASPIGVAGGDLAGTYPNPTVARLQTRNVSNTAPADGQSLVWDAIAASWKPGAPSINNIAWSLLGNAGTNPATHFIGTTDDQPLLFKLNNVYAGKWHAALRNYFIGVGAGQNTIPDGTDNIGIGFNALFSNSTGVGNTAIGTRVLYANSIGAANTANGYHALQSNTSGSFNTANGYTALSANTIGSYNVAIGANTLLSNTTGQFNIAMGSGALFSNISGDHNIGIGNNALISNSTGYENTAVGKDALFFNTNGLYNTAVGSDALSRNTTGGGNTANGCRSLRSSTTGYYNTAMGFDALSSTTTGTSNTAVGNQALYSNTTGDYNTAHGLNALFRNTTGNNNMALGRNADVTTGNLTNATAIGYDAQVDASNKVRIGNTAVTSIGGQVGWTTFSDGRYKTNVQEDVKGLAFIKKLRPVTYTVDIISLNKNLKGFDSLHKTSGTNTTIRQIGFIAQEVEAAAKSLGFSFSGVDAPQQPGNLYGIRYSEFVVPLVKAVQEQQVEINKQREEINQLRQLLQTLIEKQSTK